MSWLKNEAAKNTVRVERIALVEVPEGIATIQEDIHEPSERATRRTRPIAVRQPCYASGSDFVLEALNEVHIIIGR